MGDFIEVPMLVAEFELYHQIIYYNVVEEIIKSQGQVSDEASLISLLSARFFQTSKSNLNAFVTFNDTKHQHI